MSFEEGQLNKEITASAEGRLDDMPSLDVDRYAPYVAELQLTDQQSKDLLSAIWMVMCAMVDLGFGTDSVNAALPFLREFSSNASPDRVECDEKSTALKFEDAAHDAARKMANNDD